MVVLSDGYRVAFQSPPARVVQPCCCCVVVMWVMWVAYPQTRKPTFVSAFMRFELNKVA